MVEDKRYQLRQEDLDYPIYSDLVDTEDNDKVICTFNNDSGTNKMVILLNEQDKRIKELEEENKQLTKENEHIETCFKMADSTYHALQKQYQNIDIALLKYRKDNEQLIKENRRLKEKNKEINERNLCVNSELSYYRSQYWKTVQYKQLTEKNEQLKEEIKELEKENEQLKDDLKKKFIPFARADENGVTTVDTEEFIEICKENEYLKQQLISCKDARKSYKEDWKACVSYCDTYKDEISVLKDNIKGLEEELGELKKEKEFWKGDACNCSNYLSILSMDCQIVQEAICDLKNVIDVDAEAFKLLDELDDKFDELNQHRIKMYSR